MAAGKSQPDWLHKAISWGASVVIIGALCKIIHFGGEWANYIIGFGLGVEALLFFLTGLFPPEKDPEWDLVYPELRKDYSGKGRELTEQTGRGGNANALDAMLQSAKVDASLIESLGNGLRTFGDKVATISNVADASMATNQFTDKVKTASAGFDNLSNAFDNATKQLAELGNSSRDSQEYHEQVTKLAKNLSALNAVYELELQDSSAHLQSMKTFYQNLSLTMHNFNDSLEDSKQFKEEVGKLAKNLSSLNAIYGNMLSAMNQPRVS
ncbi:MAG: gliding motility protein GldL [Pedobacter sp.]|nr:MAG: gliding motility protein GldL [Pedobacter sp.]